MKKLALLSTVILLMLCTSFVVNAGTIPGESTGGGGGGGGPSNPHPAYSTYTPKVTVIHNINAMASQNPSDDNDNVYYVPTLSDLPFSMKDYVQNRAKNSFALVYDGAYDAEAQLTAGTEVTNGSDRVSYSPQTITTGNVANPALKSIGYDLLLVDDNYTVNKVGNDIHFTNKSTEAGTTALTASQAVMDIYKALGKFEYKVDVAFMKDKNWSTNSSPILSELNVLTSQSGRNGLNIDESYAAVAVSRTKPNLYWNRFQKDGITSGMDDNIGNGSLAVHAQLTCNENDYISYMEFLRVLVAMMNLYGEESLDDFTYQSCIQNNAMSLGSISQRSEEDKQIIYYLVAKGILDPETISNVNLDGNTYLLKEHNNMVSPYPDNYIIDILGRVADTDRRLPVQTEMPPIDSALSSAGYGHSSFYINDDINNYSEQLTDFSTYYDYLIEKSSENTYKAKIKVTDLSDVQTDPTMGSKKKYDATHNMRLTVNGVELDPLPITATEEQLNAANSGTLMSNGFKVGKYLYYGIEKHDGKSYYHFKISPDLATSPGLAFRYSSNPPNETLVKDVGTFTLPDSNKGGVYNHRKGGGYRHKSFADANYDDTYVDHNTKVTTPLDTKYTTMTFYVRNSVLSRERLSHYSGEGSIYNWTNLIDGNGKLKYNELVDVLKDSTPNKNSNYTKVVIQESPANVDYSRMQVITRNVAGVKSSALFTGRYSNKDYYTDGYYRATDGSLMVSYSYLKQKKLASSLTEVSDGVYVLTAGKLNTNVTIYTGTDKGDDAYIIVGDTMYPKISETVLVKADGDTYINFRACLGWGGDFAFISDGINATVIPYGEYNIHSMDIQQEAKPVSTFFPSTSTKLMYSTVGTVSNGNVDSMNFEGFNLSGSYSLSPYMIVANEESNEDRLFVWHRDNAVDSEGNKHTILPEDDKKARESFNNLTGVGMDSQRGYILKEFVLYKDGSNLNPRGLTYARTTAHTPAGDQSITMGWIWNPPEYSDVNLALNDYAKSVDIDTNLVLPIFCYKPLTTSRPKYYDADVNFASSSAGSDYLSVGTMPAYVQTSDGSKEKKYCTLSKSGGYSLSKDAGESTKDYILHTAPTNLFAQLKGMGKTKVSDITSGTIYFGTTKCAVMNGKVLINGRQTLFKSDSTAVCTYLSSGNSTVYCVTDAKTNLGDILQAIDTKIEYALDDPDNLVDWGQYKFKRLVMNLDAWSTVMLIFVLNILPRVCMFLFFILMALSTISNWTPWRRFCNRWFDIYSALSFGHVTVDTVNIKRLFFISIICMAIFGMIMDGQIINFIVFVAKFFIEVYQR